MTRHATIAADPALPPALGAGVRAVVWAISPDALRAYAPAIVNGHGAELVSAELRIDLSPARAALVLVSRRGERLEHILPIPAGASSVTADPSRGLAHVEIPGALTLCARTRGDGSAEIVYAQTPLLAALGLPGGVYEVPGLG